MDEMKIEMDMDMEIEIEQKRSVFKTKGMLCLHFTEI